MTVLRHMLHDTLAAEASMADSPLRLRTPAEDLGLDSELAKDHDEIAEGPRKTKMGSDIVPVGAVQSWNEGLAKGLGQVEDTWKYEERLCRKSYWHAVWAGLGGGPGMRDGGMDDGARY